MPSSASNATAEPIWLTGVWAAAFALLFWLAFPPLSFWPLAVLAPVPLTWLALRAKRTGPALGVVFLAAFVLWLWMHRFIADITLAGYPLLAAYLAAYPVLYVWLIRRAASHPHFARWPMAALVPIVWVGLEFFRGEVFMEGYPWALIAHPLVQWPLLAQSAELVGAYGVSVLVAVTAGAIVDVLRRCVGTTAAPIAPRALTGAVCIALALHAANIAFGAWRMAEKPGGPDDPVMLAVQTNLPQDNKLGWSPQQQVEDFDAFARLTQRVVADARGGGVEPDLVLWPETMLPGMGLEPQAIDFVTRNEYTPADLFPRAVQNLQSQLGAPLLVGAFAYIDLDVEARQWQWSEHYNSAYMIEGDPPYPRYDKIKLTPFGETMPYISNWPWLERQFMAIAAGGMQFNLDAGDRIEPLPLRADRRDIRLVTPICFEITVSSLCRRMVYADGEKRADVLVNLSNDGWFGVSDGGRAQHAQIARWRAIENRVPVVRAVNTGHSLIIDSRGVIRRRLGDGTYGQPRTAGAVLGPVPLDDRVSVYRAVGNVVGWTALALAVIIAAIVFLPIPLAGKDDNA